MRKEETQRNKSPHATLIGLISAITICALLAGALLLAAARTAHAQLAAGPLIRRVALGPPMNIEPTDSPFALVEQASNGDFSLVVRHIYHSTGLSAGPDLRLALPQGVIPVDLLFSRFVSPDSLLVLDTMRRIHRFRLAYDQRTHTTRLDGDPTVLGPFGSDEDGAGSALAEAPDASDSSRAFLAIGTRRGAIIAILIGARLIEPVEVPISTSPIDDLEVAPQVGYFAFVAVTGGRLVGVNPDANPRLSGPQPEVKFSLGGGWWSGIVDIGAHNIEPTDVPLVEPAPVCVVAANGRPQVRILEIPANPSLEGLLRVTEGVNRVVVDIVQIETGSLVMLAADGTGVFYQPNSTPAGGFSDPKLTLAGATMTFSPRTLNLNSQGQYVTATIEVENNRASEIVTGTLLLRVDGVTGSVPASLSPVPQLEDSDSNGIDDLTVKFDRRAVAELLSNMDGGSAVVRVGWNYADGSSGATSAQIRNTR